MLSRAQRGRNPLRVLLRLYLVACRLHILALGEAATLRSLWPRQSPSAARAKIRSAPVFSVERLEQHAEPWRRLSA
jgi:hypothetical protein